MTVDYVSRTDTITLTLSTEEVQRVLKNRVLVQQVKGGLVLEVKVTDDIEANATR
jgi:hypothetical protein